MKSNLFPDLEDDSKMRMPKRLKNRWLKALRSGEYGQLKGRLTDGKGRFCCLGVLEHVASGGSCEAVKDDFVMMPSAEFYDKYGIKSGVAATHSLMNQNDGKFSDMKGRRISRKFPAIANWIERNVIGY